MGLALAASAPALAQGAPVSRIVPVTFTGTVTNDVTNEIRIRQPDGSYARFTGPVPDYPYKKGDAVTLSFNATLPTKAFYEPGGPYRGQIAADGLYRIDLASPPYNGGGGPGGVGNATGIDVSGPITPASNSGQPVNTRMSIIYDANADSYSIDFKGNFAPQSGSVPGGFTAAAFAGPGYTYDGRTGALTSCSGFNCAPAGDESFLFSINSRGEENSLITPNIGIYGTTPGEGFASGRATGLFNLIFGGSWNLPTWNGGATQVPEPGMMFLFGGGAVALMARRRKRKVA